MIRNGFASFIPPCLRPSCPSLPSPPPVAEPSSPQTAAGLPAAAGDDRASLAEEDGEAALGRKRDSGHKKGLETRHLMVQRRFYDLVLRRKQPESHQRCRGGQGGGQEEEKVAEASAHWFAVALFGNSRRFFLSVQNLENWVRSRFLLAPKSGGFSKWAALMDRRPFARRKKTTPSSIGKELLRHLRSRDGCESNSHSRTRRLAAYFADSHQLAIRKGRFASWRIKK